DDAYWVGVNPLNERRLELRRRGESVAMLVFQDYVPEQPISIPGQTMRQRRHVKSRGRGKILQGVNDTGNVAKDREENVDAEVRAQASLHGYSDRREEDGEDELDDIAAD
ncbi:MAG: hypothetical protein Q9174_002702, partial [Haloplaca sp. 1 TL-2023]